MKSRNYLTGIAIHFAILFGSVALAIGPLRHLLKKFVYQPGDGPTKEEVRNDRIEYRGIGIPDVQTAKPPRAFCKASFEGSLYACKCSYVASNAKLISKQSLVFCLQKLQ